MVSSRARAALAALSFICVSAPAAAQFTVSQSTDPSIFAGLPTPVTARVQLGPLHNVQLFGDSLPTLLQDPYFFVPATNVPFKLEVIPEREGGELIDVIVRFTVNGVVQQQVAVPLDADDILAADVLYVYAHSTFPEVVATADQLFLTVPTGSAGSTGVNAQAVGPVKPNHILALSGVSYAQGLTLMGRFIFNAPLPLIQLPGFIELRLVDLGIEPSPDDRDLDGVPDDQDNCPKTPNPSQADSDEDGFGDPCDKCPMVFDPDQKDLDGDGVGLACDNCPEGCDLAAGFQTCRNPMQKDFDGDGVGDVCDNCFETDNPRVCVNGGPMNPPEIPSEIECRVDSDCTSQGFDDCRQPNADFSGGGDACLTSGIIGSLSSGAAAAQAQAEGETIGAPLFSLTPVSSANGAPTFALNVACGNRDLTAVNIPVRIPASVNPTGISFSGCAAPQDPMIDPERIGSCAGASLPTNVDPARSFTRGPGIVTPSGLDPNLFVISLAGALDGSFVCRSQAPDQNLPLGSLELPGLNIANGEVPSLASEALNAFELETMAPMDPTMDPDVGLCKVPGTGGPACTLLSEGAAPVPTSLTTTRVLAEGSVVTIEVRPAIDQVVQVGQEIERWQVTVRTEGAPVHVIAFGLKGYPGMDANDASFGGCAVAQTLGALNAEVCTSTAADLGPGVLRGTATPPLTPRSYVIPPMATPPTGFLADTTYVVLSGAFGSGNLTQTSGPSFMGVFEYSPDPNDLPQGTLLPQPAVVIDGVTMLSDPDFPFPAMPLPAPVKFEGGGTEAIYSSVGGTGTTLNSDGDSLDDDSDNCPTLTNEAQLDTGHFLSVFADGVGNKCTCGDGDATNDGAIFSGDFVACKDSLVAGETATENATRCIVSTTLDPEDPVSTVETFNIEHVVKLNVALAGAGTCECLAGGCPQCVTTANCPTGLTCSAGGACQGCSVDADCGAGYACNDGTCQVDVEACFVDEDCPGSLTCEGTSDLGVELDEGACPQAGA